ncbi:BrnA antitoxin family protein [Bdellovibrio bacteriovorus]|uniref:BrnA antitoxin family protein n=1 Tax=Bdellovibrio bacteriovorus TaxID=959 RepID=UPI0035A61193
MKSQKAKITYGSVEIDEGEFSPENVKVRVTAMVDGDVLDALKKRAVRESTKYQTLMNRLLRDSLFGAEPPDMDKIEEALLKRGFIKRR